MNHFKGKNDIFLIAEIGGNHEGDFEYAKKLTHLAAEAGVDAVKFQIYTADSLVNSVLNPDRYNHFKKFELKKEQYIELAELCGSLKVMFMASVWDINAFDYIEPFIKIHKIGSGDLTAYNFIKKMVNSNKPIILSTGLATLEEIIETVDFIKSIDENYLTEKKLALLQCTSMYPIPDDDANLNVMYTLKKVTGLTVGYSDHTIGLVAAETAAAMGAEIIEVHFTDEREGKTFRDHKVSATKEEIIEFIKKIKKIKILQGSFEKKPTKSEIENGHLELFRRGLYFNHDMKKDEIIKEEDLITLRPDKGLSAKEYYRIIGNKSNKEIDKFEQLNRNFLNKE